MKNLVILDQYLPNPRANGLCIDSIIACFPNATNDIICRVDEIAENNTRFPSYISGVFPVCYRNGEKYIKLSKFGKIRYVLTHILSCLFMPIYIPTLSKQLYSKANELMEENEYDNVICVINPVEAVEAGYRLKKSHPKAKLLIYDVDTVSNCDYGPIKRRLMFIYGRKVLAWERKVYSAASLIIHLENHKDHFTQECYQQFSGKTLFQGIPLLTIPERNEIKCAEKNTIRIIYSGSFYSQLREPDYLIRIINALKGEKYQFEIYTDDQYRSYIMERTSTVNCKVCGYIEQSQLDSVILSSDFVISVGNTKTDLFPSKIVYYISMLKPIIHIYQCEDDPVIDCLKIYPDTLLIPSITDSLDDNVQKIREYLNKKHQKIIDVDILSKYSKYDPKISANMIIDFLSRVQE